MIYRSNNGGLILAESARQYYWQGQDMMSVKCFFGGHARYRVGNAFHTVDDSTYLLLNHDQEYEILIDATKPIESFCVFLPTSLLNDVQPHEFNDLRLDGQPPHFYERLYPFDDLLARQLLTLRAQVRHLDAFELDERLHTFARCLLLQHHHVKTIVNELPFARASTRDEIYRRVHQARDTMLALLDQPLTLNELAAVAYMSPNHFLRAFKHIFQETPYQYLRRHRLEKARRLLIRTSLSVTEISLEVGFESLSSFSWAFRRHFGQSPRDCRQNENE